MSQLKKHAQSMPRIGDPILISRLVKVYIYMTLLLKAVIMVAPYGTNVLLEINQ